MRETLWKLPDHAFVKETVFRLAKEDPDVRAFSPGRSALGRELLLLSIGKEGNAVLLVGGTHAQEWITVSLLLKFAASVSGDRRLKERLAEEGKGVMILPSLNPDGVEIALHGTAAAGVCQKRVDEIRTAFPGKLWQANARGVDLNHNFDAGWETLRKMEEEAGIHGPAPTRYGGEAPFSEPETKAVRELISAVLPRRLYSFHAQGEEIYWEYDGREIPGARQLAETLSRLSGYRLVQNEGLASHGGLKDWFIEAFRRPGFTMEVGKGENPLPFSQLSEIYDRLLPMMRAALLL